MVKALNTVSGYFLEQVSEQSVKPVPIASDSSSAKVDKKYLEGESKTLMCFPIQAMVATLLTSLGLNHMDMGGLEAARRLSSLQNKYMTTFITLI